MKKLTNLKINIDNIKFDQLGGTNFRELREHEIGEVSGGSNDGDRNFQFCGVDDVNGIGCGPDGDGDDTNIFGCVDEGDNNMFWCDR